MDQRFSKEPSLTHTSIAQPVTEIAPMLGSVKDGRWIPGGTAVIVAPHIAMTAQHVIDADWRGHERRALPEGNKVVASYSMVAIQMFDGGAKAAWWDVQKIWWSNHADIAFLLLAPGNQVARQHHWRKASLNLLPLSVGARMSAFGYRRNSVELYEQSVKWRTDPVTAVGEVTQVISAKGEMTYVTNARFENGMSGGPVMSDEGELVGIVRSTGNGYARVTAVWSGMDTMIDVQRKHRETGYYSVLDLAKDGYMHARHWERIEIERNEGVGTTRMRMRV
ncbi:trypsin-like peptidase domain-containing protein [Candidatus Uhrbacteria bacterium]|nr:trypsin-like peptidase domain-containing protein [Candidatus Uhrbacteria bacterium]